MLNRGSLSFSSYVASKGEVSSVEHEVAAAWGPRSAGALPGVAGET